MKKVLFAFVILFTSSGIFGQTNSGDSKHLSFKGVPIDGTLNQYVQKMIQNGFTHRSTKDGTSMLKGDFAGFKNCEVTVSTLTQKDLVNKISVTLPEKENLVNTFRRLLYFERTVDRKIWQTL